MFIELAAEKQTKKIVDFFDNNLDRKNKAIHSEEFFCPFGVKYAIKRNQIIVGVYESEIISAVRFYPRKTDEIVSVYQFAVDEKYRGNKLLQSMLKLTEFNQFEFKCPKEIEFNAYYDKIGAKLSKEDEIYNYWILEL